LCDCDSIDRLKPARFAQRALNDMPNVLKVLARSKLWDDAAVARMRCDLRGDHIGEDDAVRIDNGRRCLIATRLNT
jgi:hypothetical protein